MCPIEQVICCYGCLGDHYLGGCKDYACWDCGESGHLSRDCGFRNRK